MSSINHLEHQAYQESIGDHMQEYSFSERSHGAQSSLHLPSISHNASELRLEHNSEFNQEENEPPFSEAESNI